MKQIKYILVLILLLGALLNAQTMTNWVIHLEIPDITPENANIYMAGNFNGWNPADPAYKLNPLKSGLYGLKKTMNIDNVEFKFTLGSWDKVEVLFNQNDRDNRFEKLTKNFVRKTYKVQAWADWENTSTITGNVQVIEEFYMPQLERTRRLWVYLPPGYENCNDHYSVLYMHDGQNLFSEESSFSSEWGVDEIIEELIEKNEIEKMIVVAIDNDPKYRLNEYSPYLFEYAGLEFKPQANQYATFIVETLKPYIDEQYRTKPSREHTAVMGSSMGGLISVYIGVRYQDVFSKVGALSSSFGVCKDGLIEFIDAHPRKYPMQFWLDMGSEEMGNMDLNEYQIPVKNALIRAGWDKDQEVSFKIFQGAEHNEQSWNRRLDKVLKHLYKK
jgi:predicted alpha/beta superfamily hydrolase